MAAKKKIAPAKAKPAPTKAARAHADGTPQLGDTFRYRGLDYLVHAVDPAGNGITIKRPDNVPAQPGYMRFVSGNLSDVLTAQHEGFYFFHGSVAQSMRGEPMTDLQRVIELTRDNGGRDDLAIAEHYGEPRGVPGVRPLRPAAPLIAKDR